MKGGWEYEKEEEKEKEKEEEKEEEKVWVEGGYEERTGCQKALNGHRYPCLKTQRVVK